MNWVADGDESMSKKWIDGVLVKVGETAKQKYGVDGHFSHCWVKDLETLKHVKENWPPYFNTFTALDRQDLQLEKKYQKAWSI